MTTPPPDQPTAALASTAAAAVGRNLQAAAARRRTFIAVGLIIAALGFLLVKGLGNATLYFREADEAVKQMDSLGTKRFRVEGIVVDGSVKSTDGHVVFMIEQNAQTITVTHRGDPPELFKGNIPVVLEGRFDGASTPANPRFDSDRIMVKHTNQYKEKNPTRVTSYVGKDKA